jgi:hypothetical protein
MLRQDRIVVLVVLAALAMVALPAAVALAKKRPVNVAGTTWVLQQKEQLKISKGRSAKGEVNVTLYFGPNASVGLTQDNQFLVQSSSGNSYSGTWQDPKQNGNVILDVDQTELENYIALLIEDAVPDVEKGTASVAVDPSKLKSTAKLTSDKSTASVALKATFEGSAVVEGEFQQGKGSFSAKGKGQQVL